MIFVFQKVQIFLLQLFFIQISWGQNMISIKLVHASKVWIVERFFSPIMYWHLRSSYTYRYRLISRCLHTSGQIAGSWNQVNAKSTWEHLGSPHTWLWQIIDLFKWFIFSGISLFFTTNNKLMGSNLNQIFSCHFSEDSDKIIYYYYYYNVFWNILIKVFVCFSGKGKAPSVFPSV